jgi:hypothetical protein
MEIHASEIRFEPSATIPSDVEKIQPLGETLHWIKHLLRRYVVLTDVQQTAIALWVAHAHALAAFDCTPYLSINSATKRSGKTRLLEVLDPLVPRPWLTARTSAAALVRKVDEMRPTLLLDESDTAFGGDKEYAENLRGLLNSGYKRRGVWSCCVGQGANIQTHDFSTFSAKAIAGIGALPDTIADRSIAITLRRRAKTEWVEPWRDRDGRKEAGPFHERLRAWASADTIEALRTARPAIPKQLNDRAGDVWEPLLAIADMAGGDWPAVAVQAAVELSGAVQETDIVTEFLEDLAQVLATETAGTIITTKVILERLIALEDRPWASWRHERPITGRALARMLAPLGIHPARTAAVRGYRREAFDDAFARYIESEASLRHNPNVSGAESAISIVSPKNRLTFQELERPQ